MKRILLLGTSATCTILAGTLRVSPGAGQPTFEVPQIRLYDPYPPDILPSDLDLEIARVRRDFPGI
jgi:hypothetical protein